MSKRESEGWSLDWAEDYAVVVTTKLFGSNMTSSKLYKDMFVWGNDHVNHKLLGRGYKPISDKTAVVIHRMIGNESTNEIKLMSVTVDEELRDVHTRDKLELQHVLSVFAAYQQRPRPNKWIYNVMKKFMKA